MTAPTAPTGPAAPPVVSSEPARRRRLVVTKRRATALLAAVTVAFLVVTIWGGHATWVGYVQATLEASMVGGLADWFAVTALFRRPLGLPIPHTAIVVERKDQFAETLGDFIRESFLSPDALVERVRAANVVDRLATWMTEPQNATRLAGDVADAAVTAVDLLRDDDVHTTIEDLVHRQVDAVPLAPLAGRALRLLTEDGRHDKALDAALRSLDAFLDEHRGELRVRFLANAPWWLPLSLEERIFDRLLDGARDALHEMVGDHDSALRRYFDARLASFAVELETSPQLRARGEQLKADVLEHPQLRDWVASAWTDAKERLRAQAADPGSELRARIAGLIAAAGARMRDDPTVAAAIEDGIESAVRYVATHFDAEIRGLVTGTIERWDAAETASRLELLLGPDLQYIRINGTVVGALAGLALHSISVALR